MSGETTGLLGDGIPYLAVGAGPPLLKLMGLTPTHEVPSGVERRMELSAALPMGDAFRVHVVNRKKGLRPGESMSDIAGHLASAIETDFGEPVFLTGSSTGGSVALQLAVDRPDLVRALVVVASAYRLGRRGRQVQHDFARAIRAGDARGGGAQMIATMLPTPLQRPLMPLAHLMAGSMIPEDPSDLLVTLDAEDAFDVGDKLERIAAPTLVIGGGRDPFYPRELFEQTASGVQDGRAHIYPNWGHGRSSMSSSTRNLMLGFFLAARRN